MLLTFVVIFSALIGLMMTRKVQDSRTMVASWLALVEACQHSIETHAPLTQVMLLPATVEPDPLWLRADRSRLWSPWEGGRFIIRETEIDTTNGQALRGCQVDIADWRKPLNQTEIAVLSFAFLELRSRKIWSLEYEPRDLIPPVTNLTFLGFGPTRANPVGCSTAFTITIPDDRSSLTSHAGEQGWTCDGGPPMIPR